MASCQLPLWVQVFQALLTPVVALLAIAIGVAQWRTSHQRAVLDLFEKRWEVYQAIGQVLGGVVREGRAPTQASLDFSRASGKVEFLFGPEVATYLEEIRLAVIKHHSCESAMKHVADEDERRRTIEAQIAAFETIAGFFTKFPELIKPYVKMHQKAPWF